MQSKELLFRKKKKYEQLAENLLRSIDNGGFNSSAKLPNSRLLSKEYNTSLNTMQKALRLFLRNK